jgi:hypothetical protein
MATRTTSTASSDIRASARRRRLKRLLVAIALGVVVAGYTYGALEVRVIAEDRNDLLPEWAEALLVGGAFAIGSLPVGWSILGQIVLPIPTLFLYLSIFLGKDPSLPFGVAFTLALVYSGALTTLANYLATHPDRPILGGRH